MKVGTSPHPDFVLAQELAYTPHGLLCDEIVQETESKEYGAATCTINRKSITFRVAKITPTKHGLFVTLWKRVGTGPTIPYDMRDLVDLFVISVRNGTRCGQFVFPKELLWRKGYVSNDGKDGKRGMRVYPPWDVTESKQAQQTQAWQVLYFFEIQPYLESSCMRQLFRIL